MFDITTDAAVLVVHVGCASLLVGSSLIVLAVAAATSLGIMRAADRRQRATTPAVAATAH